MSLAVDSYKNSEEPHYSNSDSAYHVSYKYASYELESNSDFGDDFNPVEAKKTFLGTNGSLMKEFQTRKRNMEKGFMGIYGFEGILDFLENPDEALGAADSSSIVSGKTQAYLSGLGAKNMSFGSFNSHGLAADTKAYAEAIAADIAEFCLKLKDAFADMDKIVGGNLETYKQLIIKQFCEAKGVGYDADAGTYISRSEFAQEVIATFLMHQGIKQLNLGEGSAMFKDKTLQTSANQCLLLLEALPEYGTEGGSDFGNKHTYSKGSMGGKSDVTKTAVDALNIIVDKVRGLYNNIVGKAGELSWAIAEAAAQDKIKDKIDLSEYGKKLFAGSTFQITAEVVGGESVKSTKSSTGYTVSKPDVRVNVSFAGVSIHYGASVKQYKGNPNTDVGRSIDIISGTSFWAALQKHINHDADKIKYVFNVAGARSGSVGRGKTRIEGPDEGELIKRWENIKDTVTIVNFLDFLAGEVATADAVSAIYIVVNGTVYPVSRILEKIQLTNIATTVSGRVGNGFRALSRGNMARRYNVWRMKNGTWAHDVSLANERSQSVQSGIIDTLTAAKMNVSLKNLMDLV